jgi:hypothetical protein
MKIKESDLYPSLYLVCQTDKSNNSELANFCQLMLDGDDDTYFVFSEKVV